MVQKSVAPQSAAFPLNGSPFFRVPPFATPWLPSVSVRHFSIATMKALRLLLFLHARLLSEACARLLPSHRLVLFARGSMLPLRVWTLFSGVALVRFCFRQKTGVLPSSQGSLFMHLCRSLGPRWDVRRLGHFMLFAASRSVHAGSTARTPHN